MQSHFTAELKKINKLSHVDKKIIDEFLKRVLKKNLSMQENPESHFCSFFVPFDSTTQSIFMGHHIRANDWIPPGGHIEKGESPLDAVKREIVEELNHALTNEIIEPVGVSIVTINKPNSDRACKMHFDFWYKISMDKKNFDYDKGEFYDARWIPIQEVLQKTKRKEFLTVLKGIISI